MSATSQRSFSEANLYVARVMNSPATNNLKQVSELLLAEQHTKKYHFPLHCDLTGLLVGSISTINVAGHSPFLSQWKETQARHPIFSLPIGARLKLARESYLRFCALSPEEADNSKLVKAQEELLQVSFLANLHYLADIRQDVVWLPSFSTVVKHWNSMIGLSYWKLKLESTRFKFPAFRVNKSSADGDLAGYLQACWEKKKEYEKQVTTAADEEQMRLLAEAEVTLKMVRDASAGKKPMSPNLLWRWFKQTMPGRYKKDIDGWMNDIFFASEKNLREIATIADIQLFAEMAAAELEVGSSISHAFFAILNGKEQLLTQHYQSYDIITDDVFEDIFGTEQRASGMQSGEELPELPEPNKADFPSIVYYLKAKAAWHLASTARTKHRDSAMAEQQKLTVKPTFIPDLPWQEDEEPSDLTALFAAATGRGDDNQELGE